MIDANEIRTLAAQAKIDPGIIEKDYVLSKALMALGQIDSISGNLIFKGGTALKKCFYPHWRYSEDLDFTSKKKLKPTEVKALFEETVTSIARLFGLSMRIIEYSQYPKTGNNLISAQLKLGYDGPLRKSSGQKNNIRVDIAFDEIVASNPITKDIMTSYTDDINVKLLLYPLEEIVAEKMRSILQRGKSRDYYDVWILLKKYNQDFSTKETWTILKKKCKYKEIPIPKADDFFLPERTEEAGRHWERGLAHQLNNLPSFNDVLDELKLLIQKGIKT